MTKIINEKRLKALAEKIGIKIQHGWKSALQKQLLQKKLSIISTWIDRGVPKEFEEILIRASIDAKIWREIVENVCNSDKANQEKVLLTSSNNVSEEDTSYKKTPPNVPSRSPDDLLSQAARVLRSKSSFQEALDSNIRSFHEAVVLREDLDVARAELKQCKETLKEQKNQISMQNEKIENLKILLDEEKIIVQQLMNDNEFFKTKINSLTNENKNLISQVNSLNEELLKIKTA